MFVPYSKDSNFFELCNIKFQVEFSSEAYIISKPKDFNKILSILFVSWELIGSSIWPLLEEFNIVFLLIGSPEALIRRAQILLVSMSPLLSVIKLQFEQ